MPPPPPGFFPRKRPGSGQDPLSNVPHRTLQGHPSLPPKPGSVKRKKAAATPKVNAAPFVGTTDGVEPAAPRPDLLSALQGQFGPALPEPVAKKAKTGTKDDYAKFVEEMEDIL